MRVAALPGKGGEERGIEGGMVVGGCGRRGDVLFGDELGGGKV